MNYSRELKDAMDKLKFYSGLLNIRAVVPDTYVCVQAFTVHYVPCGEVKGTVSISGIHVNPGALLCILDDIPSC